MLLFIHTPKGFNYFLSGRGRSKLLPKIPYVSPPNLAMGCNFCQSTVGLLSLLLSSTSEWTWIFNIFPVTSVTVCSPASFVTGFKSNTFIKDSSLIHHVLTLISNIMVTSHSNWIADSPTRGGFTMSDFNSVSPAISISFTSGGKLPQQWFAESTYHVLIIFTTNCPVQIHNRIELKILILIRLNKATYLSARYYLEYPSSFWCDHLCSSRWLPREDHD